MTLGEKIKEQRTAHGLSQETLAEQMGVSRQAVTKWEADQSAPSSEKLIAAITLHAAVGYAAAPHYYSFMTHGSDPAPFVFSLILLFLGSTWMASNHRFEQNLQQRKKNTQIELLYCLIQLGIAFLIIRFGIGLVGGLLMLVTALVYILVVNPKYMNRKLTK